MKCKENGGCPFPQVLGTHMEWVRGLDPEIVHDCHLTPDQFPIIRAMIAGELNEDALSICYRALEASDFAIDDGESRENGDNFITIWYRYPREDKQE